MNKIVFSLLLISILTSCASTGDFSGVKGKDWKLIEVQINDAFNREVLFDRKVLSKENAGKFFTIKFDEENASGTGAPNTYSAPYSLGEEPQALSIMPARATFMASLFLPEKLRENDYFRFIQNAYKWEIAEGKFVLYSKEEDGREIKLIFEK